MANNKYPEWSKEESDYFRFLLSKYQKKYAIEKFQERFPKRTFQGCEGFMKTRKLKGQPRVGYFGGNKWKKEEEDYLRECTVGRMRQDAIALFQQKYPHRTDSACADKFKQLGLLSDPIAKREWLKASPFCISENAKCRPSVPIGEIVYRKSSGKKYIKIADNVYDTRKNYMLYSHYIWEQHFGKIPDGWMIIHKDGNCLNDDISNLCLVKNPRERRFIQPFIGEQKEIFEAGYNLARLKNAIKEIEDAKTEYGRLQSQ